MLVSLTRRLRLPVLWAGFALVAAAAGLAVHRLYETARREIAEQGERVVGQELARARERVRAYTDAVRRSTLAELAGFHVDGLGHALRQWDESNEIIVGTFQWEMARGFLAGSSALPPGTNPEDTAALWRTFREWRAANPASATCSLEAVGSFRTAVMRMIDNPDFPAGDLGYQGENLEMLTYGNRRADPWAGWAGHRGDPAAPWIFWYQAGPDAAVRGCFLDLGPVVRELRTELVDGRMAQVALSAGSAPEGADSSSRQEAVGDWLPAHILSAAPGGMFREKQAGARLSALAVALLLGLFVVGAAYLAVYSRREARDAERKTTFVSQVSHELRTPLTSIRMFADMLGNPGLPEQKRVKYAETISRESRRLGALIERLLAFNALEKGKVAAVIEPIDATALVRETLDEMEATLWSSGLRVETDFPHAPVLAQTDRSALKQALLNLLDNAVKYAGGGREVRVALASDDGQVRLRVADRGPGIPRAVRGRLSEGGSFDLVLLDLMLPVLSGYDVCRRMASSRD